MASAKKPRPHTTVETSKNKRGGRRPRSTLAKVEVNVGWVRGQMTKSKVASPY